jgi:hypothetical protein
MEIHPPCSASFGRGFRFGEGALGDADKRVINLDIGVGGDGVDSQGACAAGALAGGAVGTACGAA